MTSGMAGVSRLAAGLLALAAFLVAGCAAVPPPRPTEPAGPVIFRTLSSLGLAQGYEVVSNVLLPAESYLPGRDRMPTGVVLLDTAPRARNEAVCRALLGDGTATVRTEDDARRRNPGGDFLVTHWLARRPVADEGSCTSLLALYDFARARQILDSYGLEDSRGPIFLAVDPSGEIVFLDLEDASPDQVFKATSDWMSLALSAPQSGADAGKPRNASMLGLVNKAFGRLASSLASIVTPDPPTRLRFNDPVLGTLRHFNIYTAGAYMIGTTFSL